VRAVVRERYGSPDVLTVVDLPVPHPGPADALVRMTASSVNTADSDLLEGRPRVARLGTGWPRPRSPRTGLDLVGTVEEVGRDVTTVRPGDEVWADLFAHGCGAFAELVRVPAAALSPRPRSVTAQAAAAVPHSGVLALQALRARGPLREGEHVLVNGAGGCVGPFLVQLAKAAGAEVTGVDRADLHPLVRTAGADHVVDHAHDDVTRGAARFDVVVDLAGDRSMRRWRRVLAPRGRYTLIAASPTAFVRAALGGGAFTWRPNHRTDLEELARLVDDGTVVPLLDREFPLEQVPDALRHRDAGRARGKVVVVPSAQGAGGR
jgi:NADPH:quinone reductase-like Zn-dependent oxidoreductase